MGHFYTKSGEPCHFQPDGKDTTLRHARKQDLVPSVTGILDVVSSPGLTQYFINQHLEAAYSQPNQVDGYETDYLTWCKEVRQSAGEHSKEARDKGNDIHHALDLYYGDSTEDVPVPLMKYVRAVEAALEGVYGVSMGDVDSEETFATDQWGGAVDLSNPNLIVDHKFKSSGWELKKDGTPKKIWYDSHIAQIASIPSLTWFPLTPTIVIMISSPIISRSPTRLVSIKLPIRHLPANELPVEVFRLPVPHNDSSIAQAVLSGWRFLQVIFPRLQSSQRLAYPCHQSLAGLA